MFIIAHYCPLWLKMHYCPARVFPPRENTGRVILPTLALRVPVGYAYTGIAIRPVCRHICQGLANYTTCVGLGHPLCMCKKTTMAMPYTWTIAWI